MIDAFARDLTFAWRTLWKRPLPTVAALICLALGIAASTVIFGLVHAVVLEPLPFDDPDELHLVWLHYRARGEDEVALSSKEALDVMEQAEGFEDTAGMIPWYYNVTEGDYPERVVGGRVSANLFPLLGAEPYRGRTFSPEEQEQLAPVVVLSHAYWERNYAGDESVLGRTLSLEDEPYTIIGILSEDFQMPGLPASIFVPLRLDRSSPTPRRVRGVLVPARLADGVTAEKVQTSLDGIAADFEERFPDLYPADSGFGLHLTPLHEQLVGDVRPALFALALAVAVLLLIACGNVANLLLAQAAARSREVALRVTLGAQRRDLVRQLLTESVLLAVLGGVVGILLAYWGLRAVTVADLGLGEVPRLDRASLEPVVVAFALGISLLTGVLFGLVPALAASRPNLQGMLKEGSKSTASGGRRSLRNVLVAAEIALALVVLLMAGLALRSLEHLRDVDPGFRTDRVLLAQTFLSRARYPSPDSRRAFYRRIEEGLQVLPGVRAAGLVSHLPLGDVDLRGDVEVEGRQGLSDDEKVAAGFRMVTPGYFEAMGIPLRRGRAFGSQDHAEAPGTVIVDEKLAERLWPGDNPLGQRLKLLNSFDTDWRTVVGVVGRIRQQSLAADADMQLYVPFEQYALPIVAMVVHTEGEPYDLARSLRETVTRVDPLQSVDDVETAAERVEGSLGRTRFHTLLFSLFGGVALVLAAVGVYGLLAHAVAQRQGEIGIRMALGARPGNVLRQVVGEGLSLAGAGLAVGLVLAALLFYALSQWLADVVVGVSVFDPVTFVTVPLILLTLALVASWLPARRATRVDPVTALQQE